jgi:hypothetical protein
MHGNQATCCGFVGQQHGRILCVSVWRFVSATLVYSTSFSGQRAVLIFDVLIDFDLRRVSKLSAMCCLYYYYFFFINASQLRIALPYFIDVAVSKREFSRCPNRSRF